MAPSGAASSQLLAMAASARSALHHLSFPLAKAARPSFRCSLAPLRATAIAQISSCLFLHSGSMSILITSTTISQISGGIWKGIKKNGGKAALTPRASRKANTLMQEEKGYGKATEDVVTRSPSSNARVVFVVESPAKAKTIEKYLGDNYSVLSTYGHVRDLAAKGGSVSPENDYGFVWEVPSQSQGHVAKIKKALESAKTLLLASDPDREGEAIAWHVYEILNADGVLQRRGIEVSRITFNEITKSAISHAVKAPRDLSMPLVTAYLARKALDYLIGFGLSPLLWRKLPGSKSAGRVQSSALALVCDREREIEEFIPREYWTIKGEAQLSAGSPRNPTRSKAKTPSFSVQLTHVDGQKLTQFSVGSKIEAKHITDRLASSKFNVLSWKNGLSRRNPPPPFTTSTLQRDAQYKLGFRVWRTMSLAQQLYEGVDLGNNELTGLITYMRTDCCLLSSEALQSIRSFASTRYGEKSIPLYPRRFPTKAKNAQEAHEAIRPTNITHLPSMLKDVLEKDALLLYSLIWSRTIACQMAQSEHEEVSVDFIAQDQSLQLRATALTDTYPGFMLALQDKEVGTPIKGDVEYEHEDTAEVTKDFSILKELEDGDEITLSAINTLQHFTNPPPHYSEGSLIMQMEQLGIGRPSTYAPTIKTLQYRNYVKLEKGQLIPQARGRMVTAYLSHFFPNLTDSNFTARLEEQLDEVAAGHLEWKTILRGYWPQFHGDVKSAMEIEVREVEKLLCEKLSSMIFGSQGIKNVCPRCGKGKLAFKLSTFGSGYFFSCDTYPACKFKTESLSIGEDNTLDSDNQVAKPDELGVLKRLGTHPMSGLEMTVKIGPFGCYLQLGDGKNKRTRKNVALPNEWVTSEITMEMAIELLKYPLKLGQHPEDGTDIYIHRSKFSFSVIRGTVRVSLPKDMKPDELTLEKAIEILGTAKKRGYLKSSKSLKPKLKNTEAGNEKLLVGQEVCELSPENHSGLLKGTPGPKPSRTKAALKKATTKVGKKSPKVVETETCHEDGPNTTTPESTKSRSTSVKAKDGVGNAEAKPKGIWKKSDIADLVDEVSLIKEKTRGKSKKKAELESDDQDYLTKLMNTESQSEEGVKLPAPRKSYARAKELDHIVDVNVKSKTKGRRKMKNVALETRETVASY